MPSWIAHQPFHSSIKLYKRNNEPRYRCHAQKSCKHGNKELKSGTFYNEIKRIRVHSKKHSIGAFANTSFSSGNTNCDHTLKQSFHHLCVLTKKTFNLMEAGIILDPDASELQRALD